MNKTRIRNGKTEYLYGGYVSWFAWEGTARQQRREREVRVWGPPEWDPTHYGDGSEIAAACEAKVGKGTAGEVWRY